jgi:hypothetical protein
VQLDLSFERPALSAAGPSREELDAVLKLTLKTPGWNGRTAPPQFVDLGCGCELVAIPAYLWRARCSAHGGRQRNEVIPLPRAS